MGEPLGEGVGQEVEEFLVVLAAAAVLPGGFGREHFAQDVRVHGGSRFDVHRSRLRSALRLVGIGDCGVRNAEWPCASVLSCPSAAQFSALGSRLSALNENVRSSRPARHAVVAHQRRVPGRIRVAHLDLEPAVQVPRQDSRLDPDLQRLKDETLPHIL